MSLKREEVKKEDKWNVESIFSSDRLWEDELKKLKTDIKRILEFRGKLKDSAAVIKDVIELDADLNRRLELIYTYAHLRHDEDSKNEKYKTFHDQAYNLFVEYSEYSSYFTPELLSIDDALIDKYIKSSELKEYTFLLEKILRAKSYTLSEKEEKLLSMSANAFTAGNAFSALNDADLKFGFINDDADNKLELTHSKYHQYLISKKRSIREKAFKTYHNKFDEYPVTMASLLQGKVKEHIFYAKARGFQNTLDASLFYKNVDRSVYTNLIETVRSNIGVLHDYIDFRKSKMGLDEIHLFDMYVPFVDSPEIKMSYNEAVSTLLSSVSPLGSEYVSILEKGLKEEGWVDRYENENKRSGAYSSGCYDSHPFILMNFNGTLNDARTLSHEAGHSMHTYFSNKSQSSVYAGYPIFLAEVASTFNEELFNNYLIKNAKTKKEVAYLLNSRLDEIRATLFRQTMFAEFELLIHTLVENDTPLTFQLLKKEYRKLNEFYFGKNVFIDFEIEIEWARIPHFYYNYYVYQYATGISAAIALYKRVTSGTDKERNDYLGFLKAGSSKFPLDVLKNAGVDMSTPAPIKDAINYFHELLKELKSIEK